MLSVNLPACTHPSDHNLINEMSLVQPQSFRAHCLIKNYRSKQHGNESRLNYFLHGIPRRR